MRCGLSVIDGESAPGYLCGRLAALYRRLGCLEDEILLLELYATSQVSETLPHRFVSRLAKARAPAARVVRRDSGALASVRAIGPARRVVRKRDIGSDEIPPVMVDASAKQGFPPPPPTPQKQAQSARNKTNHRVEQRPLSL